MQAVAASSYASSMLEYLVFPEMLNYLIKASDKVSLSISLSFFLVDYQNVFLFVSVLFKRENP